MKINIISTILTINILVCLTIQSATHRVDNSPGRSGGANYTTIQAAVDAAIAGDSIYIVGSNTVYATATIAKQLHFYGPGYFLGSNPNTRANLAQATISGITLAGGSSGSTVTGLSFSSTVTISDTHILFKRNRITITPIFVRPLIINANSSNSIISQCYIENLGGSGNYPGISVNATGNSGIEFSNNYMSSHSITLTVEASIIIKNNVIRGAQAISNSTITNNIILSSNSGSANSGSNNDVTYNIAEAAVLGNGTGNQESVDMSTVFVGGSSVDNQWQLATNSPAIGTGEGGVDIGMFGGTNPYVLSGIAPLPTIYSFVSDAIATPGSNLNVNMKIKARE